MVYDCFTFFNELDLLEIRFNLLNDFVDKFVLVEMTKTYSGQDKELCFAKYKERFAEFSDKIIHIIVNDCPDSADSWVRESYQRNCIARGLRECRPDDVIMISDLDEMPDPEKIPKLDCSTDMYMLEQRMYYYFLNCLDVKASAWIGTKVLSYENFLHGLDGVDVPYNTYLPECQNKGTTASKIRIWNGMKRIADAGWHFSYAGGVDSIIKKIRSFSHQEFNKPEYLDEKEIMRKIAKGEDLFGRKGHAYLPVPLDDTFPEYIRQNQDRYRRLICPVSRIDRIKIILWKVFSAVSYRIYHKEKLDSQKRRIVIFGIGISYKRRKRQA